VPGTASNGGVPLFLTQWIRSTVPSPERCVVETANDRSPPSCNAYDVRIFMGQSGHGVSASSRRAGGSPSSSTCVTLAACSRCALATQSAPVSPPPITTTCLPIAEIRGTCVRATARLRV
jgi:hypothetical protein